MSLAYASPVAFHPNHPVQESRSTFSTSFGPHFVDIEMRGGRARERQSVA